MTTATPVTGDVRTVELAVSGMTCAACSARVERTLNKLDGVRASVNYATERATVQVPAELADNVLVERIRKAGYGAHVRGADEEDLTPRRVRDLLRRLVVAAGVGGALGELSLTPGLVPPPRVPGRAPARPRPGGAGGVFGGAPFP